MQAEAALWAPGWLAQGSQPALAAHTERAAARCRTAAPEPPVLVGAAKLRRSTRCASTTTLVILGWPGLQGDGQTTSGELV